MVSTVTSTTFSQTYRDDYADSANYHRILFNSGRALQARELTQLQTIIQGEAERHARFVFKEGAPVHSGGVSINTYFEFAKLNTGTYSLPTNYSSLIGETFTGQTSTIKVRIVAIEPAAGSDPATIFIDYVNNAGVSGTTAPVRLTAGEIINGDVSGTNLAVQTTNTTLNPAVGRGSRLSVNESVIFTNGHFVFAAKQSIILSKYTQNPTVVVGFIVTEEIVTAQDKSALYDNSNSTPNLTAPGADRFRIRLTLAKKTDVAADTTFIPSFDIVDGAIAASKVAGDQSLSIIRDIMAKRTFEESGNYTVNPFILKTVDNDSDATQLDLTIGAGAAYVQGYRYEQFAPIKITINKPRSTETVNNDVIAAEYGNYVLADTLEGIPQINTFAPINLRSATGYGGSTIGTARVRSVEKSGANYRLSIFDVAMTGANNFSAVRSIGTSTDDFANLILENSVAVIKDTANNNLLFPLSGTRPEAFTDISLATQRRFTGTADGSGNLTINLAAAGETFANSSNWIVVRTDTGAVVSFAATSMGTASVTLSTLPTSTAVALAAYVNKSAGSIKTKTLTNVATTFTPEADDSIELTKADIYAINEVRVGSASGNIITNYYILDNGQRDNYYAEGKLILKTGYSAPAGDVYVDYDYFVHGVNGDFFAASSYVEAQVSYPNIPTHKQRNGETVQLRDVLDFRSRKANTVDDFTSTGAVRLELPTNTDLITADISYYKGRAYRITLNKDGEFVANAGFDAVFPSYPNISLDAMELYRLKINPYCLNENDVSLEYVDNRRYTMRDIADLESRMNQIEEVTTLNMLEIETSALEVLDDAGLNRLKVGLTADNFTDHFQSDRTSIEYKASTDAYNRELRPPHISRSSELVYDSANSTNVSLIGDMVFPTYTEVLFASNNLATGYYNGNQLPDPEVLDSAGDPPVIPTDGGPVVCSPFPPTVVVGSIKFSPSSDTWYDIQRKPEKVIDGGNQLVSDNDSLFGAWGFNWSGVSSSALKIGYTETKKSGDGKKGSKVYGYYDKQKDGNRLHYQKVVTNTIVAAETITTSMGDTLLIENSIQYMRNKFIFFKASGLRPNTRYFPFFDGIDISDWVQAGSGSFQYVAGLAVGSVLLDAGEKYKNSANYPNDLGGPTAEIFSDTNGVVEGIFFVPNKDSIKFLTGTRTFTLIDTSVLDFANAMSYVDAMFEAKGTLKVYQETLKQTRKYSIASTVKKDYKKVGDGGGHSGGKGQGG